MPSTRAPEPPSRPASRSSPVGVTLAPRGLSCSATLFLIYIPRLGMDDCVAAGGPRLVANSWRSLGALSSLARPPDLHTSSSQSQCASCHQLPLVKKKISITLLIDDLLSSPFFPPHVKPRTPLKADRRQRALNQTASLYCWPAKARR